MKELKVELGDKSYPIYIGEGLLDQQELINPFVKGKQVMIVTNTTIAPLYLEKIKKLFSCFDIQTIILPDGEQYKTLETVNKVFTALLENHFDRTCTLVALGGGVIGDITGYVAASYQRGVNFIQIPTTLLSQVDSSVGGKTGVNHALGKNMIGAFYQPKCVLIDINTLHTLENREFSAGMSEVIKYGIISDIEFFEYLEKHIVELMERNEKNLIEIIYRSCQNKAKVVAQDEFEAGKRALLNLGHTFGHGIENSLGYGVYLHGEAVAIGILMAAKLSVEQKYINDDDYQRIEELLLKAKLPININKKINTNDILKSMQVDKKVILGVMRFILIKSLGNAFIIEYNNENTLLTILNNFIKSENN
ncbi:3-dehydroquinate synthase [hydrothermal vent metagenome]|uniref:3-dehydroquinate synthase n=1 Tax=hydrothermal vent metagenome TaxID=652676 RepID=A0A1W1BT48_9ZZZZ